MQSHLWRRTSKGYGQQGLKEPEMLMLDLTPYPYLSRVKELEPAYPPLVQLLNKLRNYTDDGRRNVSQAYEDAKLSACGGSPGRCAVLTFHAESVSHDIFNSPADLKAYLTNGPHNPATPSHRLFILEDLEPGFVDVLGSELGVDPLIFSEQMNTWNYSDSSSVPHRALPSLRSPERSFTLRYYEIRTQDDEDTIRTELNQMSLAINRRKIERWRDVDGRNVGKDKRHAFVRRCASFWTSNPGKSGEKDGWDAVMLVDPPMDSSCETCNEHHKQDNDPEKSRDQVKKEGLCSPQCLPACLMLQDPTEYKTRLDKWKSSSWNKPNSCDRVRHNSTPYHGGCMSLVPPSLSTKENNPNTDLLGNGRNMASPFDEMLLYWVKAGSKDLIAEARKDSVNSAYFFLKFVAQHWSNQLELIARGVANAEWFADDHGLPENDDVIFDRWSTLGDWKGELKNIAGATKDINYMRRQMSHFERAITLNIERLGIQLGCEGINKELPRALKDAQRDFLTISTRLTPFRQRVDDLSNIANDVAALRAAFKSIQDGENGLFLSLFAAIIFPLTLIASMFSMADGYLPGQENFWVFWAASVPLAIILAVSLIFRTRFKMAFRMLWSSYEQVARSRDKSETRVERPANSLV